MNYLSRQDPLDDFFRGFFVRPVNVADTASDVPPVKIDVKEEDGQYLVHAEIPGVKREDIYVNIDGATVALSAERRQEKEVKEGERVLRTERHFGKVSRTFQLRQEIDQGRASARYTDGILELVLPKKVAAQATRLTIQ